MSKKLKKRVLLVVEVDEDLKKRLGDYCRKEGFKIRAIVAKALEEYLEKHGG